jgi:hypothetical protein
MAKVYSGKHVAKHIIDITPLKDMVPYFYIEQYVLPNKWELKWLTLEDLLQDPAFREDFNSQLELMLSDKNYYYRYNEYEDTAEEEIPDPGDIDHSIVFYKDEKEAIVIDGYSRIITSYHKYHLNSNDDLEMLAYVNLTSNK